MSSSENPGKTGVLKEKRANLGMLARFKIVGTCRRQLERGDLIVERLDTVFVTVAEQTLEAALKTAKRTITAEFPGNWNLKLFC